MKAVVLPFVLLALSVGAKAQSAQPVRASISQVTWLAGAWTGGGNIEEHWTPPAGGAMLAVSRTIKGDRMVAFEFLRIIERDGTLIYIAQPDGGPPTEFRLSAITRDSATFENQAHDFPKMIAYARKGDGSLEARVSDGNQKGQTFTFRRAD